MTFSYIWRKPKSKTKRNWKIDTHFSLSQNSLFRRENHPLKKQSHDSPFFLFFFFGLPLFMPKKHIHPETIPARSSFLPDFRKIAISLMDNTTYIYVVLPFCAGRFFFVVCTVVLQVIAVCMRLGKYPWGW